MGGCFANTARAVRFEQLVPTDFPEIARGDLAPYQTDVLLAARVNKERGLKLVPEDKLPRGGAAVRVRFSDGAFLIPQAGVRHETASFHTQSEAHHAIASAFALDGVVDFLALATQDGKVWCRDRQVIFEAGEILRTLGRPPLEVLIHRADQNRFYLTNHLELAPFGFGVSELGLEEKVREHFARFLTK